LSSGSPFLKFKKMECLFFMKKQFVFVCLVVMGIFSATNVASAKDNGQDGRNVFEFNQLTTVVPPFTGTANPIRGIAGGGAPWQIVSAHAELTNGGKIEVRVHGLTLVSTGANPVATFAIILSCQSTDAVGAPSVVNLVAGTTPATSAGDANFEGTVTAPSPCIAPIVFVAVPAAANPARWLAISGF
jgi:hypothetical protein